MRYLRNVAAVACGGYTAAMVGVGTAYAALTDATDPNFADGVLGSDTDGSETGLYAIKVGVESFWTTIALPLALVVVSAVIGIMILRHMRRGARG